MNNYIIDGTRMELKLSGKFQVFKSAIIPQGTADKMSEIKSPSFFPQGSSNSKGTGYDNFYIISKGSNNGICVTPMNCRAVSIDFTNEFICFYTAD